MRKFLFLFLMSMPNLAFGGVLGSDGTYGPAYRDYCDFSAKTKTALAAPVAAVDPTAIAMHDLLVASCVKCHGKGQTGGAGKFDDILDRDEIVRKGMVDLVTPPNSKIYQKVFTDAMPLGGPPLSAIQKLAVLNWIKAGAPDWAGGTTPPLPATFIGYEDVLACVTQDAEQVDATQAGDAANYVWFDLSNVYNTGDAQRLQNLKYALNIALNSTAIDFTKQTASAVPFKLRELAGGAVLALFAPQANKSAKDLDVKFLVDGGYQFDLDFTQGNYKSRKVRERIQILQDELLVLTKRPEVIIRGDFAVNQILLKQYYAFMGINKLKQKLADIEKVLGVNRFNQTFNLEFRQLTTKHSGVSNFNRTMQEFRSRYNLGGTVTDTKWYVTFDVADELVAKQHNFFTFPLGPVGSKFEQVDILDKDLFNFDAGEEIGMSPNGSQLFFVADAKGNLLDEAATAIVYNRDRVHPFFGSVPGAIVAGGGCYQCHTAGLNSTTDQVADYAKASSAVPNQQYNIISQVFPAQTYWDASFKSFNTAYSTAQTVYVPDAKARTSSADPVTLTLVKFLDYVPQSEAAFEFNVPLSVFQTCMKNEPKLAALVSFDATMGTVTRDGLNDQFGNIALTCGFAKQILFVKKKPKVETRPKTECRFSIVNRDSYVLSIRRKGDSTIDRIMPGVTRSGDGEIDIEYWIGTKGHPRMNSWNPLHIGCKAYEYFGDGDFR